MQEAKSGRPGSCRLHSGTGVWASEGKPLSLCSEDYDKEYCALGKSLFSFNKKKPKDLLQVNLNAVFSFWLLYCLTWERSKQVVFHTCKFYEVSKQS